MNKEKEDPGWLERDAQRRVDELNAELDKER